MKALLHSAPLLSAPPKNRFLISISLLAVALLGLMTSRARADVNAYVNIVNSAETPVMLSLINNEQCRAAFPNGGSSCILQPGQSTVVNGWIVYPEKSVQWNIIYNFYDGTDNINQRISSYGNWGDSCAGPAQSGIFSVSAGTFVTETFANVDVGQEMASMMGLHGIGGKVVAHLIDYFVALDGYNPDISSEGDSYYSITIGQQDYNIDKLAGVGWGSGTPPPVTFIQGQQLYQYLGTNWLSSEYTSNSLTIAEFMSGNLYASIGTKAGQIIYYDLSGATPQPLSCTTFSNNNAVVQLSRNAPASAEYVVAFGDSSIEYYDGTTAHQLQNSSWGSGILQMSVNWDAYTTTSPQVLVGLADGRVEYYNGSSWTELHNNSWGTSILQLRAHWGGRENNQLQAVAGLGNGSVQWWNGYSNIWTQLHDSSWNNPVYQLNASFSDADQAQGIAPPVCVALFNGSINYHLASASGWTNIRPADNNYCIIDMSDYATEVPVFVAGFRDGSVSFYDGATWHPLQPATSNRVQFISADWDSYQPAPPFLNYVYCSHYQFTFANGSNTVFVYPAIPNVNSGDVTLPDTLAVIESNAFASCTNLTSIAIGNYVTNIGSAAFSNCTSLAQIYFSGNAPSLGTNVFSGDNQATVYYLPGTTGWGSTFGGRPTALWSPQIRSGANLGVRRNRFGFDIVWAKTSGMAVVVEACTNLTRPAWSPLATNTLNRDTVYFSDSQWTNQLSRCYRLRIP